MIVIKFNGGLANQLNNYVFYLYIKRVFPNANIKVDLDRYIYDKYKVHNGFELKKVFDIDLETATTREILRCHGTYERHRKGIIDILKKIYYNSIKHYGRAISNEEWNGILTNKSAVVEDDFWIDATREAYLMNRREFFVPKIRFCKSLDQNNINLLGEISSCNSISVHVRRGDFIGTEFDQTPSVYYYDAIDWYRTHTDSPRFFLFSDDKEYLYEHFGRCDDCTIIECNNGDDSYIDMQLMSCCKNHVLCANSGFGLWAAYLNPNRDKIATFPEGFEPALTANCPVKYIEIKKR